MKTSQETAQADKEKIDKDDSVVPVKKGLSGIGIKRKPLGGLGGLGGGLNSLKRKKIGS